MSSEHLLSSFQDDLAPDQQWRLAGTHYQKTAEAWLANLDARRGAAFKLFKRAYSEAEAALWVQRWRMFFMACAEFCSATATAKSEVWRITCSARAGRFDDRSW